MSTVNFNDTTPAAPSGVVNLKFQSDASGNLSAYDPVGTWQTYAPSLTVDTGTLSNIAFALAQYLRMGPICFFTVTVSFTIAAGANPTNIKIGLPLPSAFPQAATIHGAVAGTATQASQPLLGVISGSGFSADAYQVSNAPWPVGNVNSLEVSGFFRCA